MPSWMEDLLGFNPLIKAGCSVWNWCMKIVALQFLTSPTEIARGRTVGGYDRKHLSCIFVSRSYAGMYLVYGGVLQGERGSKAGVYL